MDVMTLVKKNVNVPGLAADLLEQALEPALQKLVDDTSDPFDNMLKEAVMPKLKEVLAEEIKKVWEKL